MTNQELLAEVVKAKAEWKLTSAAAYKAWKRWQWLKDEVVFSKLNYLLSRIEEIDKLKQ